MGTIKFEVELPAELVLALNIEHAELGHRAQEWIVMELFQEGVISAGKAAEILSLRKIDFLRLLNSHGLPYLDASPEELQDQLHTALGHDHGSGAP